MAEDRARNLSPLDDELIQLLRPLARAEATVFYPFFANTFPLAFHYYHALAESRRAVTPYSDTARIFQIPWDKPLIDLLAQPVESASTCRVFYATDSDINKVASSYNESQNHLAILRRPVCMYQPKLVFVEHSPTAIRVFNDIANEFNEEVLEELLSERERIDVLTDIPDQARAILTRLNRAQTPLHICDPPKGAFEAFDAPLHSNSLRVYLYGGPLTTYLRRKRSRFIAFELASGIQDDPFIAENLLTHICIAGGPDELIDALDAYHSALFRHAQGNRQELFWPVCNAYNRFARAQQHRSSFQSASEFVQCLNDHQAHADDGDTTASIQQTSTFCNTFPAAASNVKFDRPLVLFGCGNLAIGLVLPSLHPDLPVLVVNVLRNAPPEGEVDWNSVWSTIRQRRSVNLSSSADYGTKEPSYNQKFTVVTPEKAQKLDLRLGSRYLTVADSWEDAVRLASGAGWIATSLGAGVRDCCKALQAVRFEQRNLPLLLFENRVDLSDTEKSRLSRSFALAHVICDRICSGRRPMNKWSSEIRVTSEPYGEIVIPGGYGHLFDPQSLRIPFNAAMSDVGVPPEVEQDVSEKGSYARNRVIVREIAEDGQSFHLATELYWRRKRWLMNSIQQVLALLLIKECVQRGLAHEQMPVFLAEPLIERAKPDLRAAVDVFVQCQIGRMMLAPYDSVDDQSLAGRLLTDQHPVALFENLRVFTMLNRLRCGTVTDTIGRLINSRKLDRERQKYTEHIEQLFEFYTRDRYIRIRALGVPFEPSWEDIGLAQEILRDAEKDFRSHDV